LTGEIVVVLNEESATGPTHRGIFTAQKFSVTVEGAHRAKKFPPWGKSDNRNGVSRPGRDEVVSFRVGEEIQRTFRAGASWELFAAFISRA